MAIDIIARGLASSILGEDGKISSEKLPTITPPDGAQFFPIGALTDQSQIAGKTAEEILLMALFGIVTPTFTNPSFSGKISPLVAIVDELTEFRGTLNFNRGAISPAYGTSGFRSGAATSYEVNGEIFTDPSYSIMFTPVQGANKIMCTVHYAEGEQPLDSAGKPYSTPYPAGSITIALTINGAHQLYNAQGEKVEFQYSVDEDGYSYYLTTLKQETFGGVKQSFALPKSVKVIGVQQYDIISNSWQWIGGTPEASLETFDTTIITGDSLDKKEDYVGYIHNGSKTGEREVRIFIK